MRLPNLNKLFPRLTIRTKLAVAFTAIAALPLLILAVLTIRITLNRLRDLAERSVEHDLQSVREDVEQALGYAQRSVEYLAAGVLADAFHTPPTPVQVGAVERFLLADPALFRVRVISAGGPVLLSATRGSPARLAPPGDEAVYYALQADSLGSGDRLMLPVEVVPAAEGSPTPGVPAVAVLVPVRGAGRELLGVVVGEAYAAELFAGLDLSYALVPGVTMLVDRGGLVLYHSKRKPGWDRLLATGREIQRQDSTPAAGRLLQRASRLVRSGENVFGAATLRLGNTPSAPKLTLYRAVPVAAVDGPILEFLTWVIVTGCVMFIGVLAIAFLAARQLTQPIYSLSRAAQELAKGGDVPPLRFETNDEIEDLSLDFNRMASTLAGQRRALEAQVAERTEALRRTDAELADVVSHAADAIVVVGSDARVRLWNQGAASLFGWSAAEAIGRPLDDLLMPEDGSLHTEAEFIAREMSQHGAIVNLQTRRRTRDGTLVPVSLTQSVIRDDAGTPYGQSIVLRDSTLQARLEGQMRRSERLAAVSVMSAGLAHELNNPLAIIGNRVEIMLAELDEGPATKRLRQDLEVLQGHVSRLSGVTRDLLRFARDEEDPARPANLADIVQRCAGLLERTLVTRNIHVERAADPDLPLVLVRERALETVVLNLLLNAADAMPRGGRISLAVRRSAGSESIEITVADEGTGIPTDLQAQIFEPFFTTKGPDRGTGLGLAVCRTIVESHGGRIVLESEPGAGACFHVVLPTQLNGGG